MTFKNYIFILLLSSAFSVFAQENAVKLVLAPGNLILANNVAFAYERKLTDRFSAGAKLNFSSKQNVPLSGTLSNFASKQMNSYKFTTNYSMTNFCLGVFLLSSDTTQSLQL